MKQEDPGRSMRNKRLALQMAELFPNEPEDQAEVLKYLNELAQDFILAQPERRHGSVLKIR